MLLANKIIASLSHGPLCCSSDKSRKFQMPEILTVLKFECLLGAYFEHFWLTYKTGIISLKLMHLMIFCKFLVLHLPQVF